MNVVESRDPDIQALWRLISQQILILSPAPLETAFLLGEDIVKLGAASGGVTSSFNEKAQGSPAAISDIDFFKI